MARGSRDARAAIGVRARLGAAPCAARNWGLVRPLLPAWPGAPAVVFLAFLTRPAGGVAGEWPSKSPNGHPSHHTTSPGTEVRPRGHPPVTQPPQGDLGPKLSQLRTVPSAPTRKGWKGVCVLALRGVTNKPFRDAGALLRGQLGHARRTSTSEAGHIAQVGAASRRPSANNANTPTALGRLVTRRGTRGKRRGGQRRS